jgi:hypothetical protein
MVLKFEARFMELLRYAPLLNTDKLKINKFVFRINSNIHAKVRILMPRKFHNAVQEALIAKEDLNNRERLLNVVLTWEIFVITINLYVTSLGSYA